MVSIFGALAVCIPAKGLRPRKGAASQLGMHGLRDRDLASAPTGSYLALNNLGRLGFGFPPRVLSARAGARVFGTPAAAIARLCPRPRFSSVAVARESKAVGIAAGTTVHRVACRRCAVHAHPRRRWGWGWRRGSGRLARAHRWCCRHKRIWLCWRRIAGLGDAPTQHIESGPVESQRIRRVSVAPSASR